MIVKPLMIAKIPDVSLFASATYRHIRKVVL